MKQKNGTVKILMNKTKNTHVYFLFSIINMYLRNLTITYYKYILFVTS